MISKIFGPPGTGKTTKVLSEVMASGVPWSRILYISFTRAAIKEAKERAMKGGASKEDLRWVCTQHSANRRLLGVKNVASSFMDDFAKLYGYKFGGQKKDHDFIDATDFVPGDQKAPDQFFIDNYDKARNLMVDWSELFTVSPALQPYRAAMALFVERYEAWKRENDYFDFTDMIIEGTKRGLVPPVELMAVDECQDSSPLQLEQIRQWSKIIPTVFLAGDQNQAIYEFMGTKPELFKDFPADKDIFLVESHRVPESHRCLALGIIRKNKGEETFNFTSTNNDGVISIVPNITNAIEGVRKFGTKYTYFLLSRTRWFLGTAITAFKKAGIPCGGKSDIFEAIKLIRRKPQVITRYEAEILISSLFPTVSSKVGNGYWIRGAKTALQKKFKEGFSPVALTDLEGIGATPALITALRDGDVSGLKITGDELRYYENVIENWNGNLNVVIPSTIHGSKGREADIVILLTDITRRVHDGEVNGDIESERRVWYVAVTRARKAIILVKNSSTYSTKIL